MATMTPQNKPRGRRKAIFTKERISGPRLTNDAIKALEEISDMIGTTPTGLMAQIGEACKKGKSDNWHRAVAAFQDAIEK